MVDSAYGWNIISDDFFFKIHGQIETVHFCNRATCFRHYMKFPAILVQVHLVDLSISRKFPLMTTIACGHIGIWDQLVLLMHREPTDLHRKGIWFKGHASCCFVRCMPTRRLCNLATWSAHRTISPVSIIWLEL